jgi:hypothetical protein
MLPVSLLLSQVPLSPPAQLPAQPPAQEIVIPQVVRPLPGALDAVPVFNSNSPELIGTEGILLSTFPPDGRATPAAHLNFSFSGRFDIFAHHVFKALTPAQTSLYLGVIAYNPGSQPVRLDTLQAASYLSQPDAPFVTLPSLLKNPLGRIFAGPGDRVMNDLLRGRRQPIFSPQLVIEPNEYQMLLNLPIPVAALDPPVNGRSTLMRLRSSDPIYLASLALMARAETDAEASPETAPSLQDWQMLLQTGSLVTPRDRPPTPPDSPGQIIYGRVAGVAVGSTWQAQLTDRPDSASLTIPAPGSAFSYGLSTLAQGRLGSEQSQSAPMRVRYPDTAYEAHGNYGIQYDLSLPLVNPDSQPRTVTLTLQTPLKEDRLSRNGLRFLEPPASQTFFRGSVRLRYADDQGKQQVQYIHVVQQRGQQGRALVRLQLAGGERRLVEFSLLYPPDSTPPQVLTVSSE